MIYNFELNEIKKILSSNLLTDDFNIFYTQVYNVVILFSFIFVINDVFEYL